MSLHNFLLFHLRSQIKNSCFVFHQGFQTPRNNKSTRPAASCFHLSLGVWNPWWNTRTRFWHITRSSNALCYFMWHWSCEPLGLKKIHWRTHCTFLSIHFQKVSGSHWKIQIGWYFRRINIWDYNWSYLVFGLSVITCLVYIWVDCGVIFSWCSDRKKKQKQKQKSDKRKRCKTQGRESRGTELLLLTSQQLNNLAPVKSLNNLSFSC